MHNSGVYRFVYWSEKKNFFCVANTFGASVRAIRTSKSLVEDMFLCCFPTTLQLHNLPADFASSNTQMMGQVFWIAMKKRKTLDFRFMWVTS